MKLGDNMGIFDDDKKKEQQSFGLFSFLTEQQDKEDLEDWQKQEVEKGNYDETSFEEDELEEDDYYSEDDQELVKFLFFVKFCRKKCNKMIYSYHRGDNMDKGVIAVIIIIVFVLIIAYFIYESCYYSGEDFAKIKKKIQKYIDECNDMNEHIEDLKNTFVDFEQTDYGDATNIDSSNYNYKRRELKKYMNSKYVYNCSLVVCRNAQQQPFKYLCKYFNIKTD